MIHQYKNNGYNIVLDVNSGSVHVVDDVVYDLIPIAEELLQDKTEEQVKAACLEKLQGKYETADIEVKNLALRSVIHHIDFCKAQKCFNLFFYL